jgi:hypothetical protein
MADLWKLNCLLAEQRLEAWPAVRGARVTRLTPGARPAIILEIDAALDGKPGGKPPQSLFKTMPPALAVLDVYCELVQPRRCAMRPYSTGVD